MTALRATKVLDLPHGLPPGERILWQGAPRWRVLAVRALHARGVALYFAALLVWYVISKLSGGVPAGEVALSALRLGGLAAGTVAILAGYGWIAARSSIYTVTDRRVVMRIGVALPVSFNLPFSRIQSATLRQNADGTGDIALDLVGSERMSYLIMWPHARPWRVARTQPMLRAIPDAARVAQVLARALAAQAEMPAPAEPKRAEGRQTPAAAASGHAAAAA